MTVEERLSRLEDWKDGYDLGEIARDARIARRALDGDKEIRAEGMLDKLEKISIAVERMERAERDRAKQIEGISLTLKVMGGAISGLALPQIWSLISSLF